MLILSRKCGESIVIDGHIRVTVMRVEGEAVKIGVEAPAQVPVHRQEIYDEIQRSNKQAIMSKSVALPKLVAARKTPATTPVKVGSTNSQASKP